MSDNDSSKPEPEEKTNKTVSSPPEDQTPALKDSTVAAPVKKEAEKDAGGAVCDTPPRPPTTESGKQTVITKQKEKKEPPVEHIIYLIAILGTIVSISPPAFFCIAFFGPISRIVGTVATLFGVFAIAPAFVPVAAFVFSAPARKAIQDVAHETRNFISLMVSEDKRTKVISTDTKDKKA